MTVSKMPVRLRRGARKENLPTVRLARPSTGSGFRAIARRPFSHTASSHPMLRGANMPNPIVHFEVLGKDKAVLEDFYRAAFDWQLNPVMDNYSMASTGSGINGGIGAAMDGGRGHAIFY